MTDPWAQQIEVQQPSAKPEWLTDEIELNLKANKFPVNNDGMLMLWNVMKKRLDHAKETEMQYRKICAAILVPAKTEGTVNVELGNDYKAKVVHKYNYKLDSDNERIWNCLDKIKKVGNQGAFIAERLVSWQPSFLKTEYVNLQEQSDNGSEEAKVILKMIEDILTIEIAAPTLEIKEPKSKK